MIRLETTRLLLRTLAITDTGPLAQIWADPEVTRYMGGPRDPHKIRQELEEEIGSPEPFDLWPVIEKATREIIGHCGLLKKQVDGHDEVELIYVLAKRAWGKGYATEIACALRDYAFEQLGLERLISLIDPDNDPSERVATKVGMHPEKEIVQPGGHLRRVYAIEQGEGRR